MSDPSNRSPEEPVPQEEQLRQLQILAERERKRAADAEAMCESLRLALCKSQEDLERYDELIRTYQRSHLANVLTFERLYKLLSPLANLRTIALANTPGHVVRSRLRKGVAHVHERITKLRQERQDFSRKPRVRDKMSDLLRRTFKALSAAGKTPKPRDVILALWRYDDKKILSSPPGAKDVYGREVNDPRRYWDRAGRVVHWNDGKNARQTTEARIRERLLAKGARV